MAKGRLPPLPPKGPIPQSLSVAYPPDTSDVHGKLAVIEASLAELEQLRTASESDLEAQAVYTMGLYGAAWRFSADERIAITDGLCHCRAARAALVADDAVAAATAMHDLMLAVAHLLMSPFIGPYLSRLASIAGGRKGADRVRVDRPSRAQIETLVEKIKKRDGIGETEAKTRAAKKLGIGKTLLYEILRG